MASTSPASRIAGRLRDERGLTLIEVLAAAVVLAIGVGSALLALAAPQRQAYGAQRVALASAIAERDINALAGSAYSNICTTAPSAGAGTLTSSGLVSSSSPTTPNAFLYQPSSGSPSFLALTQYNNLPASGSSYSPSTLLLNSNEPSTGETLVTGTATNCAAATTTTLPGASGVTGTIYRYVAYADGEECAPNLGTQLTSLLGNTLTGVTALINDLTKGLSGGTNIFCSASNNEKRITDAVVLNAPANRSAPSLPVYLTTLVPNPNAGIFAGATGSGISGSCLKVLGIPISCT
jgi:prepilin-type N-terminal cleavage/methylation domain-containing protein